MNLLFTLLTLYSWLILIRAVVSWTNPDPHNALVQLLVAATEPALRPLRRMVPPERMGGLDISPFLALILIKVLKMLLSAVFG